MAKVIDPPTGPRITPFYLEMFAARLQESASLCKLEGDLNRQGALLAASDLISLASVELSELETAYGVSF